jgi:hypothetical protein
LPVIGDPPPPPPPICLGSGVIPIPIPDSPESGIKLSAIEYCKGVCTGRLLWQIAQQLRPIDIYIECLIVRQSSF